MKKKLFGIALLFMMVIAFTACGVYLPNYGEKDYVATYYKGLYYTNADAPKEALISSEQALKKYRETAQFSKKGSREAVYTQFTKRLDSYSAKYFEENMLIAILHTASSGSYTYAVQSFEAQGSTLNVTLKETNSTGNILTDDLQIWSILIECPKVNYTRLNVEYV